MLTVNNKRGKLVEQKCLDVKILPQPIIIIITMGQNLNKQMCSFVKIFYLNFTEHSYFFRDHIII